MCNVAPHVVVHYVQLPQCQQFALERPGVQPGQFVVRQVQVVQFDQIHKVIARNLLEIVPGQVQRLQLFQRVKGRTLYFTQPAVDQRQHLQVCQPEKRIVPQHLEVVVVVQVKVFELAHVVEGVRFDVSDVVASQVEETQIRRPSERPVDEVADPVVVQVQLDQVVEAVERPRFDVGDVALNLEIGELGQLAERVGRQFALHVVEFEVVSDYFQVEGFVDFETGHLGWVLVNHGCAGQDAGCGQQQKAPHRPKLRRKLKLLLNDTR